MSTPGSSFNKPNLFAHLPRKPWQLLLIALFGLFVTGVIFTALVALVLTPTLPSLDTLSDSRLKVPMRVYTAEGILIAEFGEEKRIRDLEPKIGTSFEYADQLAMHIERQQEILKSLDLAKNQAPNQLDAKPGEEENNVAAIKEETNDSPKKRLSSRIRI